MQSQNASKDPEEPLTAATLPELVGLGLAARQQGDLATAIRILEAASTVAPENLDICVELGNTLRAMSRLDEAEARYRRVLDRVPIHCGALVGLGHVSKQRADRACALANFEAAARADAGNLDVKWEIANTLREMNRLQEAEAIYRRILEQAPEHVGAVLGLGQVSKDRSQLSDALAHFELAAKMRPENLKIQLEIAHTLRALLRLDEAEATYKRVLDRFSNHRDALVGLGHTAKGRADQLAALAYFEAAAKTDANNLDVQVEIANTLHETHRLEEAEAIYRRVLDQAPEHAGAMLGLGYVSKKRALWSEALAHFENAARVRPENVNIQLEIAHVLRALLRLGEAETACRRVLDQLPGHVGALTLLGSVVRLKLDHPGALEYFKAAADREPSNLDIQVEIAFTLGEINRASEAEVIYRRVLDRKPDHVAALCGLGDLARRRADWTVALAHFKAAAAADPANPKHQLAMAVALRELWRLDEAEAIFRRLDESPSAQADSTLQVKKLEHFCSSLQLDKAGECIAAWGGHRHVPTDAVVLVAGFYGACRRWHEVLEFFRERVVEGGCTLRTGNCEMLLEALARATRATGKYAEVLALLDRLPSEDGTRETALDLRDQIVEEVRLFHGVEPGGNVPQLDLTIGSSFRAWRSGLLSRLLKPAVQTKLDRTIFLCADRNYLPGAVVAMSSLLRHNLETLRRCSVNVFCSEDILELASAAFADLASAFSVRIDLRPSSLLLLDSGLRTRWALFTPGHELSEAAYYRIYAALWLLQQGTKGRALYLDSDTCVGPHIDRLLEFDLRGQPLGARLEVSSMAGIRRAALKLGLRPETYFNSGVLLFDLSHPQLATALRRAIEVSLTQKHRLTFLDQCALNLAFEGMFACLPEPFNLFVRQNTAVEGLAPDAIVRHFLERPKPWDPMYQTTNCTPWLEEFAALGQILPANRLRQLLKGIFPAEPQTSITAASDS